MKPANTTTPPNNISWTDVYFAAEAQREPFDDVNIITLKSYLTEKAWEAAHNELGWDRGWAVVLVRVQELLDTNQVQATEHVKVSNDGIRIVVDAENVSDDVCWKALDMLASALERLDGSTGKVHFGPAISYKSADITWLNVH